MKIYTAARYARREEILEYANVLRQAGHEITARWTDGDEEGKTLEQVAIMDYEDVARADMVLVFTDPKGSSQTGGGRHTELGFGYALKKYVWLVGELEQVFHSLPGVRRFDTLDQVIDSLKAFDNVRLLQKITDKGIEIADELIEKGSDFIGRLKKYA